MTLSRTACIASLLALGLMPVQAGWQLDLESGAVISGYNDVRSPGDGGTMLSLSKELSTDADEYIRARLTYSFRLRHSLSVLAAPLSLRAEGSVPKEVVFEDATFGPDTPLEATYRFDSYRLTYRYDIHRRPNLTIGLGLTGKVRDAEVRIESEDAGDAKKNTGFVPLLHGAIEWWVADRTSLMVVADALAAPQGRAEDVLVALRYEPMPAVALRVGYRVLEGGADNDEVLTFALLHYLGLGLAISF
ncbi:hypothetical protein JXA88_09425 [Candidatus Fermentibacteria bacterium]|nr:hypothetical protein [Candidatus Fermentibacteria bacterium]